ncbi:MAG: hypothetical protein KF897_02565 [Opitutaceae bacterium]|nr:hypothetical protein [Opitutaceae bacterium]
MSDWLKAPFILAGFLAFAPLLGLALRGRRLWQQWTLGLMVFMTSWHINKLTLVLGSIEWYRGHTKGYEASLITVLALALLIAARLERRPDFAWLPRGAGLWLLYCGVSLLSILAAPATDYVLMAAWRFGSAVLVFSAAWNTLREETDLEFLLRAVAFTLVVQAGVVLKLKYLDGQYQVRGWFEHQNALAMWAYSLGLPLLAVAMSEAGKVTARWAAAGFAATAIIVQGSLSRAALAAFAAGVVAVVAAGLWERPTARRIRFVLALGGLGFLGLIAAADTLIARFNDQGNQASAETRDLMILASQAMLHASPVGVGWNNFGLTINAPFPYGEVIDDWERARGHRVDETYAKGIVESHYWLLLAETGWGGWATYLLFAGVTAWWCFRCARHWAGTPARALLTGVLVGLLLLYAHSTLERVLTQTKNLAMWLIVLGWVAKFEHWRRARP